MIKKLDTSDELQLYKYKKGIRLAKPSSKNSNFLSNHSLAQIAKLPMTFYLLNAQGSTQKINTEGVNICGFESEKQSLGKTIGVVSHKETATELINNCDSVIKLQEGKIFEETYLRKDEIRHQFLSIKLPWYNDGNEIIGTCGFSIVLGKHPLADNLTLLSQLGMLNSNHGLQNIAPALPQNIHLSKREIECLQLTVKGYTAKRIAQKFKISHRTVEEYLTNLKIKMNVSSKTELIELAMNHFFDV